MDLARSRDHRPRSARRAAARLAQPPDPGPARRRVVRRHHAVRRQATRLLLQLLQTLACLPYEAAFSLEGDRASRSGACGVTRRRLLEWRTSADVRIETPPGSREDLLQGIRTLAVAPAARRGLRRRPGAAAAAGADRRRAGAAGCGCWRRCWSGGSSRPLVRRRPLLRPAQTVFLRRLARRTWRFFEIFVGADDHYLPPDNVQEQPIARVAHRTSPTNIGLRAARGAGRARLRLPHDRRADRPPDADADHDGAAWSATAVTSSTGTTPSRCEPLRPHLRLDGRQRQPGRPAADAARRPAGAGGRAGARQRLARRLARHPGGAARVARPASEGRALVALERARRLRAVARPPALAPAAGRGALARGARRPRGRRDGRRRGGRRIEARGVAGRGGRRDGSCCDSEAVLAELPDASDPAAGDEPAQWARALLGQCRAATRELRALLPPDDAASGTASLRALADRDPGAPPTEARAVARSQLQALEDLAARAGAMAEMDYASSTTTRGTCWRSATTSTSGAPTPATTTCWPPRRGSAASSPSPQGQLPQEHWFAPRPPAAPRPAASRCCCRGAARCSST